MDARRAPRALPLLDGEQAEVFGARLEEAAGTDASRLFELQRLFDDHLPRDSHYHLQLLGVVPERQGRGIGSALLVPLLERADSKGVPAYLEATSPRNQQLYERHGFAPGDVIAPPATRTCAACGASRAERDGPFCSPCRARLEHPFAGWDELHELRAERWRRPRRYAVVRGDGLVRAGLHVERPDGAAWRGVQDPRGGASPVPRSRTTCGIASVAGVG